MSYDYKNLQNVLTDYFGTAMHSGNPAAMMDLIRVQQCTNEVLLRTAQQNGFDLSRYTQNADYNPWKQPCLQAMPISNENYKEVRSYE